MTRASVDEIYSAVLEELDYQRERWGSHTDIKTTDLWDPHNRTIDEYILYIEEYVAKARTESVGGNEPDALHTVRKIAALCFSCMMSNGAPRRGSADS